MVTYADVCCGMVTYDECIRLVKGLGERGVSVKNVVVNQLLADSTDSKFVERLATSQANCLRQVPPHTASSRACVSYVLTKALTASLHLLKLIQVTSDSPD